ncbi:MAG: heat-inducible transcriptional repressor HrcA [Chloroflexota bacterium]
MGPEAGSRKGKSKGNKTAHLLLSDRQERILELVILDYIRGAAPIASESLGHRHNLGVSPATIRNDMADLEEKGYLMAPHTSAGRVPSEQGYRYYVESLMEEVELAVSERNMIRHQFHQSRMDVGEWSQLAAAMLSKMVRNMGLVTLPKLVKCRLKHVRLVAVQESIALSIIVLQEAKVKQQLLSFSEAVSQDELDVISNRLSALYKGLTAAEISGKESSLSPLEETVRDAVVQGMEAEDQREYPEPQFDGLRHLLTQPEFASNLRVRSIIEALEDKRLWHAILPHILASEGVRVVIGGESHDDAIRDCSVVLTRYGIPGEAEGALAVIGPTRMEYGRTVSAVRYLSSLMEELLIELEG